MIPKTFWRFGAEGTRIHLRQAGDELDTLLNAYGVSDRTRLAARLVCEEIVLNALEHGDARFVNLEAQPAIDPYLLIFEDDGVPFDPGTRADAIGPATPEGISTRGRGLILVHAWTRRIEHRYGGGRNRLSVRLVD